MKNENLKKLIQPVRLRLELKNEWCSQEEIEMLKKHVKASDAGSIIRDILIPSDLTLHGLHYAIQRLFGWQNGHLRHFKLDEKDFNRICSGGTKQWISLVGVLFLGPTEDYNNVFWDDDYQIGENFKIWLRKKYTGPYLYGGYIEDYSTAQASVKQIIEAAPLIKVRESLSEYRDRTKGLDQEEKGPVRVLREASLVELSLKELRDNLMFENPLDTLLERLTVTSVLAASDEGLTEEKFLQRAIRHSKDSEHPKVLPVTHKIKYYYDFGDGWEIDITRYSDCQDLLSQGHLTEERLSLEKKRLVEKHKPICIYKEGAYVLDNVGGMGGYTDFIKDLYVEKDKERRMDLRQWSADLGWSNKTIKTESML